MKTYYKLLRGFGEDHVRIEEKDLERAIFAQLTGAVFVGEGTILGSRIEMIIPDVNRSLGYNEGYKPKPEDSDIIQEMKPLRLKLEKMILSAGDRVKFLVLKGREREIGTGVKIPELDQPEMELGEATKAIASKMEIK